MYNIVSVEDEVPIHPTKLGLNIKKAIKESIEDIFEGKINTEVGVILSLIDIEDVGEGKILPNDPSVYYSVKFKLLAWLPKEREIVEGEVVDITEFGAFIRCGAFDGLVHISQIMNDYVSYDEKNSQLAGKKTRKVLKKGDKVRVRIISVSFKEQNKLGLTMRQPLLGAFHWLEEEKSKKEKKKKKKGKERKK